MTRSPDLVIIGAGVVGAACAMYAAQRGFKVLVLERWTPASGATSAGMGHIVVMDDSPAQLSLTSFSRSLLGNLALELPAGVEYARCGTLWIAASSAELDDARAKGELYRANGLNADLLDEVALAEAEPELRRGLAGALRVADDGVLYQPVFTRWLLERAVGAGAEVRTGVRVTGLARHGVNTSAGPIAGGAVLVAAGVDAVELLPELPMIPRKGHLAVTTRAPGMAHHQLVELGYLRSAHTMSGTSVAFNVQPRATGQLLVGSSRELSGRDTSINRQVLAQMLQRAVEFMPRLAQLDVLRVWTGLRPATPDKLPLIGACPGRERVWVAAGHEGLGITTALGTGALVIALFAGEPPPLDAEPFRVDRTAEPAATSHG
jgi:glycine/D-amino acid oxidase-like deaminating enzyme